MRRPWAALLLVLAVAGCGHQGADRPREPLQVHAQWSSCAEAVPDRQAFGNADATTLPLLADGFVPVSAVVCDATPARRPDGGEDLVGTEGRTDDIAALVAALRLPDVGNQGANCTADLPIVPWFALLDAGGRWVRPGAPTDACGKIRIEVRNALGALPLIPVSTTTLREIESAAAVKAGCSQSWADMVWVETSQSGRSLAGGRVTPFPADAQIRLCVYRVPADEQRTGKPAGTFEYGGILPASRWSSIATAISSAGPARTCTDPAGRFAVLRAADGSGHEVYVELDNCQRIMATPLGGPPSLAQADAALVALLAAAE